MKCNYIALAAVFLSFSANAQLAVKEGDEVPKDGVFLTNEEAAKVLAEQEAAEKRCKENTNFLLESQGNKCVLERKIVESELQYEKEKFNKIFELKDQQNKELLKRVDNSDNNIYWFSGGTAIGVVTTLLVTVGVYFLVSAK